MTTINLTHKGYHSGVGQLVGVVAIITAIGLGWTPWLLATVFTYFLVGLAITIGFHRWFSHYSWEGPVWLEKLLLFIGTLSGSGSSIQWCVAHLAHHKHADTDQDPHNVKGIWSAWLVNYHYPEYSFVSARHLLDKQRSPAAKWHLYFHHHYWAINLFVLMVVSILFGWQGAFYGLILPIGGLLIMGGIHNVAAHWGKRPRNIYWYGPISMGEYLHANHHETPGSYTFSRKWYQFDVGAWVIRRLRKVSVA